ncbi:outer membrane beta-barrel protein [Campylobacter sp. CX2-8023-23]|uniref:Outer membrane beta-barrel protein n=1 Tax=Campylobacter porcelli TaxID=1660073 RepID=A0ABU7M706_9BACT|nr:outer membrane beta-barrel protein [Campylobacter sp. CX2-8023-23]MEE3744978.1 outer membrane beta-barrel protein [Campylobacter sp. CX2-4855-23]
MFKLKSTVLILSLSATFALADGYFIGFSGGFNHSSVDEDNYDLISDNNLLLSPKFGYQVDDAHRYSLSYEYGGKSIGSRSYNIEIGGVVIANEWEKYKFTSHRFLLGYDYTPLIQPDLRADIGVFVGYSLGEFDVENSLIQDIAPAIPNFLDGFSYGAKLGALYEVDDKWNIEFGARIMHTMYKSKDLNLSFDYGGATYEIENKPFRLKQLDTSAYLGVSYKF